MNRLEGVDLNLLLTLGILLDEGSVTGAARRLGITQPAVSHKLKRLRELLGDELFVVGPRGLVPTERARAIATPLRAALQQLEASVAGEEPFDPATDERRFVMVGADLFEFAALPAVLEFLAVEAPHVALAVAPRPPRLEDIFEAMERGEVHYAFGPSFPSRAGVRQFKLSEESLVVLGRPKHPAFRGGLTLDKYLAAEHILISPGGQPGGIVDAALARRGRSRRVAVQVAHFTPAPYLASRSDLLLTAPETLAREAARHWRLSRRPVPLDLPRLPNLMAWHERFDRDPGHRWFREATRRFVAGR